MPPPPPPSATGTVGADVPPASGRGRLGGQWGPGLEMGQKARRTMFPWGDSYCHHCRQLACLPPFPSVGSTEAGGSQDVGAVSPQTTMMLRAYCEDRHWPRDSRQLHRRARNSPRAPTCPTGACSHTFSQLGPQPVPRFPVNQSHLHPTQTLNLPDFFSGVRSHVEAQLCSTVSCLGWGEAGHQKALSTSCPHLSLGGLEGCRGLGLTS